MMVLYAPGLVELIVVELVVELENAMYAPPEVLEVDNEVNSMVEFLIVL
jgi:hypothetical protein